MMREFIREHGGTAEKIVMLIDSVELVEARGVLSMASLA